MREPAASHLPISFSCLRKLDQCFLRSEDRVFQLVDEQDEGRPKRVESYVDAAGEELNPRTEDSPEKSKRTRAMNS